MRISMILVFLAMATGCATTATTPYEEFSKPRPKSEDLLKAYENAKKFQICDCIGTGFVTSSRFTESLPEARVKAEEDLALCIGMLRANGGLSPLCSQIYSERNVRSPSMIYVRDGDEVFAIAFLTDPSK